MKDVPVKVLMAAAIMGAAAILIWVRSSLELQSSAFQATIHSAVPKPRVEPSPMFATFDEPPSRPAPTVYLLASPSPRAALVLAQLGRLIDMPFRNETALEDALKYIRASTQSPGLPEGIPIYVDPIGLQEAEKSEQTPVKLDLADISVSTGLRLMLRQLGLKYHVQKDGLLIVTSVYCDRESGDELVEPEPLILDNLTQLRAEVAALRWEIAALRSANGQVLIPPPGAGSCMMGGTSGMGFSGMGPRGAICGTSSGFQ